MQISSEAKNPYSLRFYHSLEKHNVQVLPGLQFADLYLKEHAHSFDAIHLQWVEYLWPRHGQPIWKRLRAIVGLQRYLRTAIRLRKKVVVTMHNVRPHESFDWVDRIGFTVVNKNCDLVVCHSRIAAEQIRKSYKPGGDVVVMHHGNYDGDYPPPRDIHTVRRELGFAVDRPLVSCLGVLREYKGYNLACDAIRLLKGDVQLLIAGEPYEGYSEEKLKKEISTTPASQLLPKRLSTQEYSDYLGASDLVLLPYERITGSGALLAAWSIGRCVVASNLDFFREMKEVAPDGIRLFASRNAKELALAIEMELRRSREDRQQAAETASALFSWEQCVLPVVDVISSWGTAEAIDKIAERVMHTSHNRSSA